MSAMECASCGGSIRSTDAFCGRCGQAATGPDTLARLPVTLPVASSPVDMAVPDTLDPLSNGRYAKQLLRRFALYAGVALIANVIVFVLDVLLSLIRGTSLLGFVGVFATLSLLTVFVVFWVLPVPALLVNWHQLLTFRAPEAGPALSHVQQALDRHHTPYDSLRRRRMTPPGEGGKEYLELRRGFFAGYVSCFAHGDDLYIALTFWIYVSPIRALIMRLGRKVQDYTGRGNDIYQTLRFESTQATINVLKACTLEGIEFATRGPGLPPDDAELPPPAFGSPPSGVPETVQARAASQP